MNKTEKIEINADNAPDAPEVYYGEYTVKRWTWYEKQQASSYATEVIDSLRGIANWSVPNWYTAMLKICVTPPEELLKKLSEGLPEGEVAEWNEALIQELDPDVGDILRDKCMAMTGTDKKGFLGPSEEEKDILT